MKRERQNSQQSWHEAWFNTLVGFMLSVVVWQFVAVPVIDYFGGDYDSLKTNLIITTIFTFVSLLRNYLIRRLHVWFGQ